MNQDLGAPPCVPAGGELPGVSVSLRDGDGKGVWSAIGTGQGHLGPSGSPLPTLSLIPQPWIPQPQGPAKWWRSLTGVARGPGQHAENQAQGQDSVSPAAHSRNSSCALGPAGTADPRRDLGNTLAPQGKPEETSCPLQMAVPGRTGARKSQQKQLDSASAWPLITMEVNSAGGSLLEGLAKMMTSSLRNPEESFCTGQTHRMESKTLKSGVP